MTDNWLGLKEPKKKKKKKQSESENFAKEGMQFGLGMIGLGIGLHALHDLTD
jgi:hypothetical protein